MHLCRQCGVEKDESEFYRHRSGVIVDFRCKPCNRARALASRDAKLIEYREKERLRKRRPENIEAQKAYAARQDVRERRNAQSALASKRHPERVRARARARAAIAAGVLHRKPCEVCGSGRVVAHHDDYRKALDVRWLCATHHTEWHVHNVPKYADEEGAV